MAIPIKWNPGWGIRGGKVSNDFASIVGTEVVGKRRKSRFQQAMDDLVTPPGSPETKPEFDAPRRAWAESDGKFYGTASSHHTLPGGIYRMDVAQGVGPIFLKQPNDTDSIVELPDSESENILSEIEHFGTLRAAFKEYGFLYKRGILLWGPPGSGKTCTIQMALKMLIEDYDSVAVIVEHPAIAATCLQTLRRIEPTRQIVALMEDFDSLIERHGESEFLSLLDGEAQIDNIVYIATTNYPQRLDKRFVDRPSRFDTVRYIGMPSQAARAAYMRAKIPAAMLPQEDLDKYVGLSEGYSIAHMREFVVLTRCFGMTIEAAHQRLEITRNRNLSSESSPDRPKFGFT